VERRFVIEFLIACRERIGVENYLGENRLRWLGHLDRMDETHLIKLVREERVPKHMKRGKPKKSWDEVVKEDIKKRGLCVNNAQDRNKWVRCCWRMVNPSSVNREEDSANKAERRRRIFVLQHLRSATTGSNSSFELSRNWASWADPDRGPTVGSPWNSSAPYHWVL